MNLTKLKKVIALGIIAYTLTTSLHAVRVVEFLDGNTRAAINSEDGTVIIKHSKYDEWVTAFEIKNVKSAHIHPEEMTLFVKTNDQQIKTFAKQDQDWEETQSIEIPQNEGTPSSVRFFQNCKIMMISSPKDVTIFEYKNFKWVSVCCLEFFSQITGQIKTIEYSLNDTLLIITELWLNDVTMNVQTFEYDPVCKTVKLLN